MTDEPDDRSAEDAVGSGSEGPPRPDRSGLVAGEAAAIARFGDGPALFSAAVPAPRHPHVGPLLPPHRTARPAPSSTELVPAPVRLPARRADTAPSVWTRTGAAARRGVEVVVDWTARGVVAAVGAVGAAAQAVVTLIFGPDRAALTGGERRR